MTQATLSPVRMSNPADAAFQREYNIKLLRDEIFKNYLELAQLLYVFWANEDWKNLGYETLTAWLADPEINISRRTAYRLIGIHKTCVLEHRCATVALKEVGISKIDQIIPYMTSENKDRLLSSAANLSRSDLREELKEEFGGHKLNYSLSLDTKEKYKAFFEIADQLGIRNTEQLHEALAAGKNVRLHVKVEKEVLKESTLDG